MLRLASFYPTDNTRFKSIWLITSRSEEKNFVAAYSHGEPPTHYFVYGKGHQKVKKTDKVELLPKLEKVESYEEIYNLVKLYGYKIAGEMLGFDNSSFGDVRKFRELYYFEKYGQAYVSWLNSLAEVDQNIFNWLAVSEERRIAFFNNKSWKRIPYMSPNIESAVLGIIPLAGPSLDVIRFHDAIMAIFIDLNIKNRQNMSVLDMLAYMEISVNEDIVGLDKPDIEILIS